MKETGGSSRLNKALLPAIKAIPTPNEAIFELPEKILQFGTGVLLRGLPDYYVDQANKQGVFNGRILVVKSTPQNSADDFKQQDGLYTLCLRGWQEGQATCVDLINAAISRVVDSATNWSAVVAAAANPEMQIIFSNTTEVGIVLDKEDLIEKGKAPRSFPGKLLAFLLERFEQFGGDPDKGMVIIPTELIADNGSTLKRICLELAKINKMSLAFIHWLETANVFCDSLVDRIVSGKMQADQEAAELEKLGYTDNLMIMSEVYSLWAIQTGSTAVAETLSFQKVNPGVIISADIEKYRHLKLFLLNAPHTFTCVIAQALGFQFVNQAMADDSFYGFIRELLMEEAVPAVIGPDITEPEAIVFAEEVLDRFKNPYIDHRWSDISKQMTLKMGMRCLPLIRDYFEKFGTLPQRMMKGFAAYLCLLQNQYEEKTGDSSNFTSPLKSSLNGQAFNLVDAKADLLTSYLNLADSSTDLVGMLEKLLQDDQIWPAGVIKSFQQTNGLVAAIAAATVKGLKSFDFGKKVQIGL